MQGNMRDILSSPRSISLVLAASVLTLSLPHYSRLPVFYFNDLRFDMVSEIVWYFGVNSTKYSISLREVLSYLRWLPLAILVMIAIRLTFSKRGIHRSINRADGHIGVFLVFALISCWYSIAPSISVLRLTSVVLMYGAIFWGIWVIADVVGQKKVVRVIVNTAAVLFALHIFAAVVDPVGSFPYYGRFEGWMTNPGTVSGYAASFLPLALYFALQGPSRRYWFLVASIVLILIMSQTRTELLSASIGSLYFLFSICPKRRLLFLMSVIILLVSSFVWIEIGPRLFPQGTEFSWNRVLAGVSARNNISEQTVTNLTDVSSDISLDSTLIDSNTDSSFADTKVDSSEEINIDRIDRVVVGEEKNILENIRDVDAAVVYQQENPRVQNITSLSNRTEKWKAGVQYLLERPLQGFGFGTEHHLFAYHNVRENQYIRTGAYFHNSYLGLALQVGLVGALLFYVPIGVLLMREMRITFINPHDHLRVSLLSVVLTCMIAAMASSDLYSMGNAKALPFWVSIMLLVRYRYGSSVLKK